MKKHYYQWRICVHQMWKNGLSCISVLSKGHCVKACLKNSYATSPGAQHRYFYFPGKSQCPIFMVLEEGYNIYKYQTRILVFNYKASY